MFAATLLAILASVAFTFGLYFMKREAARLPSLGGGWRPSAWRAFARDPWWVLGVGLQIVGAGFYFMALRAAPLSVVHTALNGGLALFVVLSVVGLGERPRPLEWVGVAIVMAGLMALSGSLSADSPTTTAAHDATIFSLVVCAIGVFGIVVDRAPRRPIGLSIAAGLILGLGSVFAKALATADSFSVAMQSPDLVLTVVANIVGFALMQGALQAGRGVVVVPIFSTLSNLVPIIGGVVVYGEQLPQHGAAAVLRPAAFALALLGAALLAGMGEAADRSDPQGTAARSR